MFPFANLCSNKQSPPQTSEPPGCRRFNSFASNSADASLAMAGGEQWRWWWCQGGYWGHIPNTWDSTNHNGWLAVCTPLKNISQWEGLSHILWKITCSKPPIRWEYDGHIITKMTMLPSGNFTMEHGWTCAIQFDGLSVIWIVIFNGDVTLPPQGSPVISPCSCLSLRR